MTENESYLTSILNDVLKDDDFVAEQNPLATKEGIEAAATALAEIRGRSFSGRHSELGKMINCICGLRHRANERACIQKFATTSREGDPIQGELVPPEGLTQLTKRQIFGAAMFAKKRINPHSNRYLQARINKIVAKKRKEKLNEPEESKTEN